MAKRWRMLRPEKLKTELLIMRGFKEVDIADRMGVSRQTIASIFKPGARPRLPTLEALMDETGLTPSDLFEQVEMTDEEVEAYRSKNRDQS